MAIFTENERTLAVVGIPLSVEPGEQVLSMIDGKGDENTISFTVTPHAYAEQRLTITNKRKVNPAPLDMVRITAENKRQKLKGRTADDRYLHLAGCRAGLQPVWSQTIFQRSASQTARRY